MKDLNDIILPEDVGFTDEHVWLRIEGEEALVGISDFAQDQLGEIAFVDLPAEGAHFGAGDEFGTVESLKSVNPLYMPVAGTILAANEELEAIPTLVNVSPYEKGWMLRIKPDSTADAATLADSAAYRALLQKN
ncbi:MAG: glycine cleavage system protein GcvH [Desulfovibrio sp.]|uniref:glycine cleavage system protein GcvH n=1 Tax=Desulfovibrio sp. TaxID=885 RepID=UPI002A35C65D|nr:glycine cleavage system protein GcvH [Desulfovibrio sp.]MDY0258966.1 glycine cleavage system protein GcvH [Desulfovibrio sp.]